MFTAKTNESIGSVFTKAQYKQYTDATFTKLVGGGLYCPALDCPLCLVLLPLSC